MMTNLKWLIIVIVHNLIPLAVITAKSFKLVGRHICCRPYDAGRYVLVVGMAEIVWYGKKGSESSNCEHSDRCQAGLNAAQIAI